MQGHLFPTEAGFDFGTIEVVDDQCLNDKSSEAEERSIDERHDAEKHSKRRKDWCSGRSRHQEDRRE